MALICTDGLFCGNLLGRDVGSACETNYIKACNSENKSMHFNLLLAVKEMGKYPEIRIVDRNFYFSLFAKYFDISGNFTRSGIDWRHF